ncbi:hypothetical protein [Nonomuraea africana]|uniref:Transposase n=1 Tax=Nonomuraea africana TaxID=46171 RepID=A0ABR9KGU7_9ACTN|nr:hypothetical protein [Nonomuraea africana]MBE1561229.1 hypothetical protein [Nonomuraea africana]
MSRAVYDLFVLTVGSPWIELPAEMAGRLTAGCHGLRQQRST